MQTQRPLVLSIAGFDPCAGAGVLADIKTFEQLKVQGMAVVTALTAQTENSVTSVDWQETESVQKGIRTLMESYKIEVVKIGIVRDTQFLKTVIECVKSANPDTFIIWDPVIKSSSGAVFFKQEDEKQLSKVINEVDLLTPNVEEYRILKLYIDTEKLPGLLIKGGHRIENKGWDILIRNNKKTSFAPNVETAYPKHGSGCVLSAAIAAYIALGKTLEEACILAKSYVEQFLNSHPALLGHHNHV